MTTKEIVQLESIRGKLLCHPIYWELDSSEKVKVFMKHHVFAVWDFMSLLKRLQQSVTTVSVPWFPYEKPLFSRLINEIVVAEESDIDGREGFLSHFELYLEAMDECGADSTLIKEFMQALKSGEDYIGILRKRNAPDSVIDFVSFNLNLAKNGELYEVAAAFFYGREGLIPEMFKPLVQSLLETGVSGERLVFYLNRHIEVDEEHHGPLAKQLLLELCKDDPEKLKKAIEIGEKCFEIRSRLWDGVLAEISGTLKEV